MVFTNEAPTITVNSSYRVSLDLTWRSSQQAVPWGRGVALQAQAFARTTKPQTKIQEHLSLSQRGS